jgi:hypothetical protein
MDAAKSLEMEFNRFAADVAITVRFEHRVTFSSIYDWNLPTREPKRNTATDSAWPTPSHARLTQPFPTRLPHWEAPPTP